jgi:hypothetical protein
MLQDADLDAAVRDGILTAEQASALRDLAKRRERERAISLGHEERFRFMRGFNDVFFAIGVLLFISGLLYFIPFSALGLAAMAAIVWGLAELLVGRLRLVLPSILLACAFVGFVFAASVTLPVESWLGMGVRLHVPTAWSFLQFLQNYPGGPLMFAARALVAAAAAGLFYWRFKLPFALLPLAASLVVAAIGVASFLLPREAAAVADTIVLLLCGLGVFAAAMTFDTSDRERLTRRADCAFWLHLLAAPLIVHSVISLVSAPLAGALGSREVPSGPDMIIDAPMSAGLAGAIALIVLVLAVVAVLIDRRALLVSGLAYLGAAVGSALIGSGVRTDPSFVFAATLVILGAFVLTLGAGWVPLRRLLLRLVSPAISNRLPPVLARP